MINRLHMMSRRPSLGALCFPALVLVAISLPAITEVKKPDPMERALESARNFAIKYAKIDEGETRVLKTLPFKLLFAQLLEWADKAPKQERFRAHRINLAIADASGQLNVVREAILLSVKAAQQGSVTAGTIGAVLRRRIVKDFDEQSRAIITGFFRQRPNAPRVVDLVGIAGIQELIPELRAFAEGPRVQDASRRVSGYDHPQWRAQVNMAKLGDAKALRFCINKIRSDKHLRRWHAGDAMLLEICAYIRQPETVEILRAHAFSDVRVNTSMGDVLGLEYWPAWTASALLSKCVEDCPQPPPAPHSWGDQDHEKADYITQVRAWLNEQGKLRIIR